MCLLLPLKPVQAKENSHYQILESRDHDEFSFTQGLEIYEGLMYESSGLYGKSSVRKYQPDNDDTLVKLPLADEYFAEGLTLLNGELFVLSWRKGTLFVMDPDDLAIQRRISYEGDAWGLANNGQQLIMSDGSDTIYFRDPENFAIEREVKVSSQQHAVHRINELEYVGGTIWANIWLSSVIVNIDPDTGELTGYYDLQDIVKNHLTTKESVLNGIAYDETEEAFWITGKLWSKRYLIKFGQPQLP